jgi:hypothetical protein
LGPLYVSRTITTPDLTLVSAARSISWSMSRERPSTWEIPCPCCGATLTIDAKLGKVLQHTPPPKEDHAPDLAHAAQLLEKEKARREALFQQGAEEHKIKSDLLDRKFQEALNKTKDEPVTKPLRDFDLD